MQLLFSPSKTLFHASLTRFFSSIVGYCFAIVLFLILSPIELIKNPSPVILVGAALVVISLSLRVFFRIKDQHLLRPENEKEFIRAMPRLQLNFVANTIFGALCWSFLMSMVVLQFGGYTPKTLFVYLTVVSILTTGGPTFAHNKWVWMGFILSFQIPITACSLITDPIHNVGFTLGTSIVSYYIFASGRLTAKQARELYQERDGQKAQLEYFKSVIEAVPGLVTIFDGELRYRLINSRVSKFTGISEDQFYGRQIGFSHSDEFISLVRKFYESPISYFQTRLQLTGTMGPRWFIVTMSRLNDNSQIAVVSMDIDDHMKAEQAALDQRAVAESSARLAAIGELAAGIAHEINNPLAVITTKAEQTIRKLKMKQQEAFVDDLEKIRTTAFRIATIVRGLKNLSRNGESEAFIDWKISEIVTDVCAVFEAKLKSFSISMDVQIPEGLSSQCHPTQVGQVLMNMVSNAFDVLRAMNSPMEQWIRVAAEEKGEWIEISVTDSGPGIPEEVRKKLMTPFFTTKAAGVGTGLGLSISRRIANDHKGEFYLDETSEHTRFVLKIPKVQKAQKAA